MTNQEKEKENLLQLKIQFLICKNRTKGKSCKMNRLLQIKMKKLLLNNKTLYN